MFAALFVQEFEHGGGSDNPSGFVALQGRADRGPASGPFGALPVSLRADVFDGLVDHPLKLVRGNVREGFAGLADSLVKDAPADSFLDELRNAALFSALGAQEGSQVKIGLLGPSNRPAGVFLLRHVRNGILPIIRGRILQSLNLKNPKAYSLAAELSHLTGESLTGAVIAALEERLEAERRKRGGTKAERILAFAKRFAKGMPPGVRSEGHVELYGADGMPR